jgi:hypothetical protein
MREHDWQPISSAPRDGTRVALLTESGEIDAGFYDDYRGRSGYTLPGEWSTDQGHGEPTHWRELPAPPEPR